MRVYFARHGESEANLRHEIANRGLKYGLTRKGREQANGLADRLKGLPITRIYSSPLLRVVETSIILANRLDLDYEVTDALREYDCGILEGRSDEAGWAIWKELYDDWSVHKRWERRIEGSESFYDVRERFVPFIEGLIHLYRDTEKDVLCISHGGVYVNMLPLVVANMDEELFAKNGFDYTTCIVTELKNERLVFLEYKGLGEP